MDREEMRRWGLLLDALSQLSDMEYQVVAQGTRPGVFVPDELIEHWYMTFRGGQGLRAIGMSDAVLSVFLEFDYHLDELIDLMPETIDDPEHYIRHDEAWQAVRELADWTLQQVGQMALPDEPNFSFN